MEAVKTRSQNGEHSILLGMLYVLGITGGTSVEIGVDERDGVVECNTGALLELPGWDGKLIDEDAVYHPKAIQLHVDLKSIADIMHTYCPDVFSLDIDGNDYWVMQAALKVHQPKVVICEYNVQIEPVTDRLTIPYNPDHKWDGSQYFGASAGAMVHLMHEHEYKLYTDCAHVNLFFVREDLLPLTHAEPTVESLAGPIVSWLHSDHWKREYVRV